MKFWNLNKTKILYVLSWIGMALFLAFLGADIWLQIDHSSPRFKWFFDNPLKILSYYSYWSIWTTYIVFCFFFIVLLRGKFNTWKPKFRSWIVVASFSVVTMFLFWSSLIGINISKNSYMKLFYNDYSDGLVLFSTLVHHLVIPIILIILTITSYGKQNYSFKNFLKNDLAIMILIPLGYLLFIIAKGYILTTYFNRDLYATIKAPFSIGADLTLNDYKTATAFPYVFFAFNIKNGWTVFGVSSMLSLLILMLTSWIFLIINNAIFKHRNKVNDHNDQINIKHDKFEFTKFRWALIISNLILMVGVGIYWITKISQSQIFQPEILSERRFSNVVSIIGLIATSILLIATISFFVLLIVRQDYEIFLGISLLLLSFLTLEIWFVVVFTLPCAQIIISLDKRLKKV